MCLAIKSATLFFSMTKPERSGLIPLSRHPPPPPPPPIFCVASVTNTLLTHLYSASDSHLFVHSTVSCWGALIASGRDGYNCLLTGPSSLSFTELSDQSSRNNIRITSLTCSKGFSGS